MKKRIWTRLVSFLLVMTICITMLPATAIATLLDNDIAYNQQILAGLKDIVGSEDEAQRYYAMLQQYGLLEDDGSMPESWEIYMDGKEVGLDEIKAMLDEPDCDLSKQILVDGTAISLENVKTILEIEDYIAYLQETYFDGDKWTAEQQESLKSLQNQIETDGIVMANESAANAVWPSGVNHNAQVSVTGPNISGSTATFTATLSNAADGQTVSFNYAALSGSQPVSGSGTVTLTGNSSQTFTVTLGTVSTEGDNPVRSSADLTYYLKLDGIKNALFSNGSENRSEAMTLKYTTNGTVGQMPSGSFDVNATLEVVTTQSAWGQETSLQDETVSLTDSNKKAVAWGLSNAAAISQTNGYDSNGYALTNTSNPNMVWYSDDKSILYLRTVDFSAYSGNDSDPLVKAAYSMGFADGTKQNSSISCTSDEANISVNDLNPDAIGDTIRFHGENFYIPWTTYSGSWVTTSTGKYEALKLKLAFSDTKAPTVKSISAPSGTYYPGQVVPVTVTFSEPVDAATVIVQFNGQSTEYNAAESSGYSNVLTFPYTVRETDNTALSISSVTATDTNNLSLSNYNPGGNAEAGKQIEGVTLSTPFKSRAITGVTATIDEPTTNPVMQVKVKLNDAEKLTNWLTQDMETMDGGRGSQTKTLKVSVDGGETMYPLTLPEGETLIGGTLTANIPLPLNTADTAKGYTAELYLAKESGNELLFGKFVNTSLTPAVFIEADNLSKPTLSILDKNGEAYKYEDENKTIYLQDEPTISATFTLSGSGYSFGDTSKVTTYTTDENGQTVLADTTAHFVWSSSDPSIANIDKDGKVSPTGKKGDVTFTITALNGRVENEAVSVKSDKLHFGAGLTPFISIPNRDLSSVAGQSVTVFWSSNLCDKNGDTPTNFTVTLKKGETEVWSTGETPVTGTADKPAASCTIPGDKLTYSYDAGSDNKYKVTVSAKYNEKPYEASAKISLSSPPAKVNFNKLNTYYITDKTKTVDIGWDISNFDRYSAGKASDLFQLKITKGNNTVYTSDNPGDGSGTFTGKYTLDIADITADKDDPTSYRDVYTVTIQAKNGTDSTWSYDSFMLYVYDEDALKIWVDGDEKDSITMSNIPQISQMEQKDILALKRDIYLKNIISVNYGEYAWNEIADQIKWKSEDNNVASVNYQQGTLYENIKNFSYVSYRPTTELGVSGLSNGKTTITATHKLTDITKALNVNVETLKDKLYLFQCYPQTTTTLRYKDSTGKWKEATSDKTGAAAIYEENGIHSDVYCTANVDDITYLGTYYLNSLATGEGDWTKLERYPCNNLTLRRAAYAYMYVKNPDGTPYTGEITFRGGVYVNDTYKDKAEFKLNNNSNFDAGNEDQTVKLGDDGKLTVTMDQTQWDLKDGAVTAQDDVSYVFQVSAGGNQYYPMLLNVDANINEDAFVGSGEAIVNFRQNADGNNQHPFIVMQGINCSGSSTVQNVLDTTGKVGPNDSLPEVSLNTVVMWWGQDMKDKKPKLQLKTEDGIAVADSGSAYTLSNTVYPFSDVQLTQYTVKLNKNTLDGVLDKGKSTGLYLDYYQDGKTLSRHENLSFQLSNMLGVGKVKDAESITTMLSNMGKATGTDASSAQDMDFGDEFVQVALNLVSSDNYTTENDKLLNIRLRPTSDPTKFLGFISVKVGSLDSEDVIEDYGFAGAEDADFDYTPGLDELMVMTGNKTLFEYAYDQMDSYNKVLKRQGDSDWGASLSGYAESMIYFNEESGKWEIQILNGGFNAGGGMSYTWNWNTMCGPVPFTATLTIGGTAEVGMDALSVSYYDKTTGDSSIGNDFLTQLRIYLYMRFFAGVGIDYAVVAFKLGIFGQLSMDMQFQWLNRPYMYSNDEIKDYLNKNIVNVADDGKAGKLNGQHFKLDGQIGLEFVVRILFISYDKVLYSYSFNLLNESTRQWDTIQTNWESNQTAQKAALSELIGNKSMSVSNVGGQQMLSLNLAPTVESRDYLKDDTRFWNSGGFSLFSLDKQNALEALQYNSYPYANPVVSDDGQLVAYLSDSDSTDVGKTRAAYAVLNNGFFERVTDKGAINDAGYGDSQIALSGTEDFAVSAWTRQMQTIDKDAGAALTDEDQMIMMNSSEIYAGVYQNGKWETTSLTENSSADLAPVVATNGSRAIVAWRAVSASGAKTEDGYADVTNFNEKDTILYRVYDGTKTGGESKWSDIKTLYNGTSGAVKGITAAMLNDGTTAVAYTLDTDTNDETLVDREICYAVVDKDTTEVARTILATNDTYLDENPQLAAVTFPSAKNQERFVLGWYTEQSAAVDDDDAQTKSQTDAEKETTSDLRLLDFDSTGTYTQLLPDSISQVSSASDVSITPTFRFTKNADSINDLSIVWVERDEGEVKEMADGEGNGSWSETSNLSSLSAEKDVLKGVKFYTYGEKNEMISFTGAVDVAEMEESTLIDHFDAYVSNPKTNEIKAVILGSTYGADGTTMRTGKTTGGDTVQYKVPSRTTSMYTATETYTDKIEVPAVLADYETVKKGATTQVQFTVENKGIHAINKLDIKVGDNTTKYDDLNLLPGSKIQLWADYTVPQDDVEDPNYTVKASFDKGIGSNGSADVEKTAEGTVYLDLPDVEITDATIVEEENRERKIQVKLNNDSDATLTKSNRSVKVSFYSDATCEKAIDDLKPVTISGFDNLKMLDEGGYSFQTTFNVKDYLDTISADGSDKLTEIPDNGLKLYMKAEVLEESKGKSKSETLPEPISSNNYATVTCENLKTRTGKDVSVTSDFSVNADGKTSEVTVSLQNNKLSQTTTGNVIVSLLDARGNVLEQQQSYTGTGTDNGLVTLTGEQKKSVTFKFSKPGASVSVAYTDAILTDDANAKLASLTLDGVALTYDEATKTYTGSASNLSSALLTIVPEDLRAKVTVNKKDYTEAVNQRVSGGKNTFEIIVTAADNTTTQTYTLVVDNKITSSGGGAPTYPPTVTESVNGNVSISPTAPMQGDTVTITPKPNEGYGVDKITVTDQDGKPIAVKDNGDGTYSFTQPSSNVMISVTYTQQSCKKDSTCPISKFTDANPKEWYHDGVHYCIETGLMAGVGNAKFLPNGVLTRAQLAQILYNKAGKPAVSKPSTFTDVRATQWYANAIAWAQQNKVVNGIGGNKFAPEEKITREQLAAMLYRSAGSKPVTGTLNFKDAANVSNWAKDAMLWATQNKVINGALQSDGTLLLNAKLGATRAETATMLENYYNK